MKINTRIQNIHQLQERGEFVFWKQLKESLERHGNPIKVLPRLDGRQMDMFALYRLVVRLGGHKQVTLHGKWSGVASELKISPQLEQRGQVVQELYQQYLATFEEEEQRKQEASQPVVDTPISISALEKQAVVNIDAPTVVDRGFANQQVEGEAHPPAQGLPTQSSNADSASRPGAKPTQEGVLDQRCEICLTGTDPGSMLLCDACDGGYHTYCLQPKVKVVPKGNWYCPRCKKTAEVLKDAEPFGFEDGPQYSLTSFHTLAESYKQRWFSGFTNAPTADEIERDFWDIVEEGSALHDVQVLYGSDLPTLVHGSGFPTETGESYTKHGWNLNVLPTQPGSLLRYLDKKVSGLIAPWMYVGMLFSSFCWHNEDNYLYSINYMHWGASKTWYGIPGSAAEHFEAVMRASMPELFSMSPDLLFHITTMLSPRVLQNDNVPCYKIVQEAGSFVVTFPKAYHAGFSHGFNCGEAVNFGTPDWLTFALDATERYRKFGRPAAFSLQKLLIRLAESPAAEILTEGREAIILVAEMLEREVAIEHELRASCEQAGMVLRLKIDHAPAIPAAAEEDDDDGRLCHICKHNCFLSFAMCPCAADKCVCLRHRDHLCSCHASRNILFYRDEPAYLDGLCSKLRSLITGCEQSTA
jgi:histone demethylase JARID1